MQRELFPRCGTEMLACGVKALYTMLVSETRVSFAHSLSPGPAPSPSGPLFVFKHSELLSLSFSPCRIPVPTPIQASIVYYEERTHFVGGVPFLHEFC